MQTMRYTFQYEGQDVAIPPSMSHVTAELLGGPADGTFVNVQVIRNCGPRRIVIGADVDGKVGVYKMIDRVEATGATFARTSGQGEHVGLLWRGWIFKYEWRGFYATPEKASALLSQEG